MERARRIEGHLRGNKVNLQANFCSAPNFAQSDEDVVIVAAKRTPICKAKRGSFKDTSHSDLLNAALHAVLKDGGVRPDQVQDICVGNVLRPGSGANDFRMAQLFGGFPETVPLTTCNRQCSSGLQAVMNIVGSIRAGQIDIGIGAGVESMSIDSMGAAANMAIHPKVFEHETAVQCLLPMGMTSENVAERYGITRQQQDEMAVRSHANAAKAQNNGLFDNEIVPVKTVLIGKDGEEKEVIVSKDDGVREGTNLSILGKLRAAFKENGSTTAGNSSQVSDGAAAVLLARRNVARKLGLPILGVVRSYAVEGVRPDVMGIGPAVAIPSALKKLSLNINDIEIYEINEAFASQATYCVDKLGIPAEKVNPKGGAIALGHPLGCTGARQISTLLHELKRRGKRGLGVVSMCIGTGMGAAAVIEYPGN
ncbi:DgyrCDS169 [Dimorphilus gyrociliatus]|uniref:DgyrCDS169 n=1 Tax=Dimorphilus gyrociliatus TaxID=2664684 RepID=A0A7I8V416_9ANNE|nr:DgyrCDS169 [Dimorphilus gyrociliatus]